MLVIKGAGDLASGVAVRLFRAGIPVVMTEIAQPMAIRRTVCFCDAVLNGVAQVEDITARHAGQADQVWPILAAGEIAVLVDPETTCLKTLKPLALVDGILAKRNTGTSIEDAPIVIGLGPGFTAGLDCHAVVETMRGHTLGRVYYEGRAADDTGLPGDIAGYTRERVLRAPASGIFEPLCKIGDVVQRGAIVARVDGSNLYAELGGIVRGLMPAGTHVRIGLKCGDIDPRCELEHCFTVSDKASAIGGGVLEAVLKLAHEMNRSEELWKQTSN